MSSSVKPIPVDPTSPVPLYFQAAQHIQRAIETGELPPGSRLDNELLLAEQFGLSRPTMRRAMQYLVDKGLLVRKRGIGTQVVDPAAVEPAQQADPSRAQTGSSPGLDALGNVAALVNARPASSLTAAEIAAAARTPLTILGRILRETHDGTVLTTQQTFVLSQLMATDALPITDLAEADGRAVSTMAETVTRMAKAGLVEKSSGVDDRRQVLVSITPKGRAAVEGTLRQRTKSLVELIERLSGEDRRALAAALPALWKLADNDPGTWPRIPVGRPPRKRRGLLVALPADCFVSLTISQRGTRGSAFRSWQRSGLSYCPGSCRLTWLDLAERAMEPDGNALAVRGGSWHTYISVPLVFNQGNEVIQCSQRTSMRRTASPGGLRVGRRQACHRFLSRSPPHHLTRISNTY